MLLGQLDNHAQQNTTTPLSYTTHKWVKDLSVKSEAINLLGENIGDKFLDIGPSDAFWIWFQRQEKQKQK